MTRLEDRQILMRDIAQARADGARLAPACALAGFDPRTLQRWKTGDGLSAVTVGQMPIVRLHRTH